MSPSPRTPCYSSGGGLGFHGASFFTPLGALFRPVPLQDLAQATEKGLPLSEQLTSGLEITQVLAEHSGREMSEAPACCRSAPTSPRPPDFDSQRKS